MKLSYVYGAISAGLLVVGMFLSEASVEANLAVIVLVLITAVLAVFYLIRENPVQPVVDGAYDGVEIFSPAQRKAEYEAVKDLSRQMRNEADPVEYMKLADRRAVLAKRIGL